jgi:hypothetical protein
VSENHQAIRKGTKAQRIIWKSAQRERKIGFSSITLIFHRGHALSRHSKISGGAILTVVHDRYFIESFASNVWTVKDGKITK